MSIHRDLAIRGVKLTCLAFIFVAGCGTRQQEALAPMPTTVAITKVDESATTPSVRPGLLINLESSSFDVKTELRKGESHLGSFGEKETGIDRAIDNTRGLDGAQRARGESR